MAPIGGSHRLLCACGSDLNIFDYVGGEVVLKIEGTEDDMVTAFAVHPSGRTAVVALQSNLLKNIDLSSGKVLNSWKGHPLPVLTMDMDPTGTYCVTGSADRSVMVWHVEQSYATHVFRGHSAVVTTVQFHPSAERLQLVSGSDNGQVKMWDLISKQEVASWTEHVSTITALVFSPDGYSLLSAARDATLQVYEIRHFEHVVTIPLWEAVECCLTVQTEDNAGNGNANANRNSWYVLAGLVNGRMKYVNVASGQVEEEKELFHQNDSVQALVYVPHRTEAVGKEEEERKRQLLCVSSERLLQLRAESRQEGWEFQASWQGYLDHVTALVWLDAQTAAVALNSVHIYLINLADWSCSAPLEGHTDMVVALALSTNGLMLASAAKDNTIRLWNWKAHKCLGVGHGHMENVTCLAFNSCVGGEPFLLSGSSDKTLKRWNLHWTTQKKPWEDAHAPDASPPRELHTDYTLPAHQKSLNALAVAPNGLLVASASQDRLIHLWESENGKQVGTLQGHKRGVWSVAFSTLDKCLLSASGDGTCRLWNVKDFSCLRVYQGQDSPVLSCSFVTSSTQFVTVSGDGCLRLFSLATAEMLNAWEVDDYKCWALTSWEDGNKLLIGSVHAALTLWEDKTGLELENEQREAAHLALRQQDLQNKIALQDFAGALPLALALQQPVRVRALLEAWCLSAAYAPADVVRTISHLQSEEQHQLLSYIRDWNTRAATYALAQMTLQAWLEACPSWREREMGTEPSWEGLISMVEGLLPYNAKHYERLDRLMEQSYLLDFIQGCATTANTTAIHAESAEVTQMPVPKTSKSARVTSSLPPLAAGLVRPILLAAAENGHDHANGSGPAEIQGETLDIRETSTKSSAPHSNGKSGKRRKVH